ncbi:phosphatase PAP2 family protein [Corynebacterium sp.]|uniref:phosphatase PAP2 family protein n=1 Tax=Corynebacterium sp. TaxID=1720 RepID=UPI0028AFAB84|nr:phosphatase PAP2 family protein [Corynebacterium sp.]
MTDRRPAVVPAAASVVAALVLVAVLWTGWVHHWSWIDRPDTWALDTAYDMADTHGWWVPSWDGLSHVFGPGVWRVLVVVPVLLELCRHRVRVAVFLAVSVWGSGIVSSVVKQLANRDRPVTQLVAASGTSFPSGHALGVLVAVGALLIVYSHLVRRSWRTVIVVIGVLLCVAIGVARVALNVHHPSDVLAGWALGYAWLMLCLYLSYPSGFLYRGRYTGNTR